MLKKGLKKVVDNADLAEALGLSLIRQQKKDQALKWLAKAANLASNNVRYGYVYAVALNSQGKIESAIKQLESINQNHPVNTDILYALVTFNRDAKHFKDTLPYLKKLQGLMPDSQQLKKLQQELSLHGY